MILQQLLNVELPIIQAPMAGAQDSLLAIAVAEAGGLGSLPCAMLGTDALRAEVRAIRSATDRPFNLNFFCHPEPVADPQRETVWLANLAPYYAELGIDAAEVTAAPSRQPFSAETAGLLEELRPSVVSFHFGLPSPELLERVKALGAIVLSSATTVDEARWLEAHGADVIVAQGYEAGGHRGMFLSEDLGTQLGTFALVRQIVGAVKRPVVAAGGIADGEGVAAAVALGAAGVQVGTAFLLCPEATTSRLHRAALESEAAQRPVLTNVFTGRPARGIVNRAVRELGPLSSVAPAFPLAAAAIAPLRVEAEARGLDDFSPLWCGQNAQGWRRISACELTRELARGFDGEKLRRP